MDSSDPTQRNIVHGEVILSPRVVALGLDQIIDPLALLARHLSERWLSVKGQVTSVYDGPAAILVFVITDMISKRTVLLCGDEDEDALLQGELKLTQ